MISKKAIITFASALFLAIAFVPGVSAQGPDRPIRHVLLVSVDGMHVLDYLNCSRGIGTIDAGEPYCPNLAELGRTGLNYLDTSASKPSDSFPGLMALVTGGSPRTVGAFYDVAYDRVLAPPALTTGNGVAAGACNPFEPNGTRTEYDEGIDIDQTQLNGGAPGAALADGGIASIDPRKLIRNPNTNCGPVFPWHFIRTNTIFGVAHAAGLYTAWSDKHPSYSAVSGGNGTNVDDYYSPEITPPLYPCPASPLCSARPALRFRIAPNWVPGQTVFKTFSATISSRSTPSPTKSMVGRTTTQGVHPCPPSWA